MRQQTFSFITDKPKLATKDNERYWVLSLTVTTKVPRPRDADDMSWTTEWDLVHHTERIGAINMNAGDHVLQAALDHYRSVFTVDSRVVKSMAKGQALRGIVVSHHCETLTEIYEVWT